MKVDQLYLIGIEMDEKEQDCETETGLKGLARLYGNSSSESGPKAAQVESVFVTIADQKMLLDGNLKELRGADGKSLSKTPAATVGVYVYIHGASGMSVGRVGPGQLATLIKLLPCKPENVRKVCVIGCSLAKQPYVAPNQKWILDCLKTRALQPFIYEFCEDLKWQNTMVAGWPGYVGVYRKEDKGLGLQTDGADETEVAKKLAMNQGKKVVAHKEKQGLHLLYRTASNKELEQAKKEVQGATKIWDMNFWYEENMHYNLQKRIYRWDGKTVVSVSQADYTDNEQRKKTWQEIQEMANGKLVKK